MVPECEFVGGREEIRQGDVFRFLEMNDSEYKQYGIVVTADCDLAHEKHNGILSYVPLLEARTYLKLFWLQPIFNDQVIELERTVHSTLRTLQRDNLEGFDIPMSEDALSEWIRNDDIDEILSDLDVSDQCNRERLKSKVRLVLDADGMGADNLSYDEMFGLTVDIMAKEGADDPEGELAGKMKGRLKNLGADCIFLGELGPELRDGYIAYLRLIRELNEDSLATTKAEESEDGTKAKRIGRLKPRYLFKITRQTANVFSRIGLPNEYEKAREEKIEGIV